MLPRYLNEFKETQEEVKKLFKERNRVSKKKVVGVIEPKLFIRIYFYNPLQE